MSKNLENAKERIAHAIASERTGLSVEDWRSLLTGVMKDISERLLSTLGSQSQYASVTGEK